MSPGHLQIDKPQMELLIHFLPSVCYHCSPIFPISVNDVTNHSYYLNTLRSHPCFFSHSISDLPSSLPAGYTYLSVACPFYSCLLSMSSSPLLPFLGLCFSLNFHPSFLPIVARIILKFPHKILTLLA